MNETDKNAADQEDLEALLRSIEHSPLALVITDNLARDNPIVGANEAFFKLTGYSKDEVIGRNCRFLAGLGTEREARLELRRAIDEGRATVVELTNYRKDGSPFRNAVMIAPVRGRSLKPRFFVGSQMDTGGTGTSGLRTSRALEVVEKLTPRLRQVLELMISGYRNKQIAAFLGIGEKTVKMHRQRLIDALEVKSSAEAVRIGVEAGLLVSDRGEPKSVR